MGPSVPLGRLAKSPRPRDDGYSSEADGRCRRIADLPDNRSGRLIWAGERTFMHLISAPRNLLTLLTRRFVEQKSYRPCENSATQKALSEFRGLRSRRAEKITKIRSPRDYTEFPIEFSHGLLDFCTKPAFSRVETKNRLKTKCAANDCNQRGSNGCRQ